MCFPLFAMFPEIFPDLVLLFMTSLLPPFFSPPFFFSPRWHQSPLFAGLWELPRLVKITIEVALLAQVIVI